MNHEMTGEIATLKARMQSFINDEVIPQEPVLLAEDEQAASTCTAMIPSGSNGSGPRWRVMSTRR